MSQPNQRIIGRSIESLERRVLLSYGDPTIAVNGTSGNDTIEISANTTRNSTNGVNRYVTVVRNRSTPSYFAQTFHVWDNGTRLYNSIVVNALDGNDTVEVTGVHDLDTTVQLGSGTDSAQITYNSIPASNDNSYFGIYDYVTISVYGDGIDDSLLFDGRQRSYTPDATDSYNTYRVTGSSIVRGAFITPANRDIPVDTVTYAGINTLSLLTTTGSNRRIAVDIEGSLSANLSITGSPLHSSYNVQGGVSGLVNIVGGWGRDDFRISADGTRDVNIDAGAGDSSFEVYGGTAGVAYRPAVGALFTGGRRIGYTNLLVPVLNAGSGNDSFEYGGGNVETFAPSPVFNGGAGSDTFILNNQSVVAPFTYILNPSSLTARRNSTGTNYTPSFTGVDSFIIRSGAGGDVFDINGTPGPSTLYGGAGNDLVDIGDFALVTSPSGLVFDGEGDTDIISLYDGALGGEVPYSINGTTSTLTRAGLSLGFGLVETLTLTTGAGVNTISVLGVFSALRELNVNASGGSDVVYFGDGFDVNLFGTLVQFNGGTGANSLIVDSQLSQAAFNQTFSISESSITTAFLIGATLSPINTLTYSNFSDVIVRANAGNNTFNVAAVAAGVRVSIAGGNGDDTYNVPVTNGASVLAVEGSLVLPISDGFDRVNFNATNDATPLDYKLTGGTVTIGNGSGSIDTSGLEAQVFNAGGGDDTWTNISGPLNNPSTTINAGGGNDTFNIDATLTATMWFINGEGGTDQLNVSDTTNTSPTNSWTVSSTAITRRRDVPLRDRTFGYAGLERGVLVGSPGADVFVINSAATGFKLDVFGDRGNDVLYVNSSVSGLYLDGGYDNDQIFGNGGNETIFGGDGNDTLWGGAGNDVYRFDYPIGGPADTDVVAELANQGTDTFDFSTVAPDEPVRVDLTSDTATAVYGARRIVMNAPGQSANIENITGGSGNDTLTGNAANNTIMGGSGTDSLRGENGADSLVGDGGNDTFVGGAGSDTLVGGGNDDLYRFGGAVSPTEADRVSEAAGGGTDTLDFSALPAATGVVVNLLSDTLATHTNRVLSTLVAGQAPQFENVIGSISADTLTGNAANNTIMGGSGTDSLRGENGADSLVGDGGNDTFVGGAGSDTLVGGGNDDLYRFGGAVSPTEADRVSEAAGGGTDTLDFSALPSPGGVVVNLLSDTLATHTNRVLSTLVAGQAPQFENVIGSISADTLTGNNANNTIVGGLGNDTLTGGLGLDRLDGGDNNDTFFARGNPADADTILGGAGSDSLQRDTLDSATLVEIILP